MLRKAKLETDPVDLYKMSKETNRRSLENDQNKLNVKDLKRTENDLLKRAIIHDREKQNTNERFNYYLDGGKYGTVVSKK
jgi:hypothetical protein